MTAPVITTSDATTAPVILITGDFALMAEDGSFIFSDGALSDAPYVWKLVHATSPSYNLHSRAVWIYRSDGGEKFAWKINLNAANESALVWWEKKWPNHLPQDWEAFTFSDAGDGRVVIRSHNNRYYNAIRQVFVLDSRQATRLRPVPM